MRKFILSLFVCCFFTMFANAQYLYTDNITGTQMRVMFYSNSVGVSFDGVNEITIPYHSTQNGMIMYQSGQGKNLIGLTTGHDLSVVVFASSFYVGTLYRTNSAANNSYNYSGGYNNSSSGSSYSSPKYKQCSYCKGRGWVPGSKTATYGLTGQYYCSDCGEYVNQSHSHDQCPSCGGTGQVRTSGY